MIALSTGRTWLVCLTLLAVPILMAMGCGATPQAFLPTADEPAPPVVTDQPSADLDNSYSVQPASPPPTEAIAGDLDGNGSIDQADEDAFLDRFGKAFGSGDGSVVYDSQLDINADGVISWADLQLFVELLDAQ